MTEHLQLFITTFVLTLTAIFILIPLSVKVGLVDKPAGRKQTRGFSTADWWYLDIHWCGPDTGLVWLTR